MSRSRTIAAFLLAPLITPLVFMVYDLFRHVLVSPQQVSFYFVTYGVFAYLATILFGIPALLIFRWLRLTNIVLFLVGGAVIGLVVSMFVMEGYTFEYFMHRIGERMLCAVAGGLSAMTFRIILLGFRNASYRVPAHRET